MPVKAPDRDCGKDVKCRTTFETGNNVLKDFKDAALQCEVC